MSDHIGCLRCQTAVAIRRGLCPRCYNKTGDEVRAGKTTWVELEAIGKALPAKKNTWFGDCIK